MSHQSVELDAWRSLLEGSSYVTPSGAGTWAVRHIPCWPTFKYHTNVFRVFLRYSRIAETGGFGRAEFTACCWRILNVVEKCGGVFNVEGLSNLRHDSPAVFVSNHMGSLETLILGAFILPYSNISFVLKESLLKYPVFGHIVREVKPVTVRRVNPRDDLVDVLSQGTAKLKDGVSMVIFPQATRSEVFDVRKFNTLGLKLAQRAGVPMIPVGVKTDFLRNGRLLKDASWVDPTKTIRVRFGGPVSTGSNPREAHRQAVDFIVSCLEEWGAPVVRD